jgi:hypothetical protein
MVTLCEAARITNRQNREVREMLDRHEAELKRIGVAGRNKLSQVGDAQWREWLKLLARHRRETRAAAPMLHHEEIEPC